MGDAGLEPATTGLSKLGSIIGVSLEVRNLQKILLRVKIEKNQSRQAA
jgi:hypothetical protein